MKAEELQEIYRKDISRIFPALDEYVNTHTKAEHYKTVQANTRQKYQQFVSKKKAECLEQKKYGNYLFHFCVNCFLPKTILKNIFRGKYRQYGEAYFGCQPYEFIFMQEEFKEAEDIILNWEHYKDMYSLLSDAESRHTFSSILLARILGIKDYYKECFTQKYPQYFDKDILTPALEEVFVDGGAFIGDTAIEMNKSFCSNGRIISYELDSRNAKAAEDNWRKENIKNAKLRLVGLSDENKKVQIVSAGNNSHIAEGNEMSAETREIRLVRLDDDLKETVTFIKLDIEGEEKAAIKGMKRHIQVSHPKLAICVYHLADDLWKIPELIHEIDESYRFFLRHYTDMEYETVLYAI